MSKEEILSLFKQAEKDWKKPQRWWQKERYINSGFCYYFEKRHNINIYTMQEFLKPCWLKYRTTKIGAYHFTSHFRNPERARKERLESIRKVIKDLSQ
jgi:hypothetical protein